MKGVWPLLAALRDGHWQSGQRLAEQLGISRTALHNRISKLKSLPGIEVYAIRGKGYRLASALDLLDEGIIRSELREGTAALTELQIFPEIGSTNDYLMGAPRPKPNTGHCCLAEHQLSGKGRNGRNWHSVVGTSLILSFAWTFELPLAQLSGLSLATGVVLAEMLSELGAQGHRLKWPNDLLFKGGKLAGILVEASGEMSSTSTAVIGIGINLNAVPEVQDGMQPAALAALLPNLPHRNQFAARLIEALLHLCQTYQEQGLAPYLRRWSSFDAMVGKTVTLIQGQRTLRGQYVGLNELGFLLLDTADGRIACHSGEVSLREATT